jgi:hypothetical protein
MSETASAPLTRTRAQLCADFLDLDRAYSEVVQRCSPEQLLWRPPEGGWSIAECIEHVARVNSQYLPPMKAAIAKGKESAVDKNYLFSPGGWFSAAFLRRIGPRVTIKFKAPGKIRPVSVEPEQAFQELRRGHIEIQEMLAGTAQLDLNRIRFKNRLFRFYVSRSRQDSSSWRRTGGAIWNKHAAWRPWSVFRTAKRSRAPEFSKCYGLTRAFIREAPCRGAPITLLSLLERNGFCSSRKRGYVP